MKRAWGQARNILAVRLDRLGDVLMTTPAFTAIKQAAPDMRLTLLTSHAGAAALSHIPSLDDAIVYSAPWVRQPEGIGSIAADRALIEALSARNFDAAVIFTVCTQSALPAALMCRLAGIGLRLAHSRENPYELLTDWVVDTEVPATGMRHEVARQLDLVRSVGFEPCDERLVFHYQPADVRKMRQGFAAAGGRPHAPYIVVHPGASAPSRRYPAERFGQAAQAIAEATGCQVVLTTGDAEEAELLEACRSQMRAASIALPGLPLGQLAALLAGAQVLLCNNTGPAHIAAALGTPVVVLYALTNPQHTPWKARARVLNHDVPCRNCLKSVCREQHHDCLERVEAQAVVQAALELIGPPPPVRVQPATAMPSPSASDREC